MPEHSEVPKTHKVAQANTVKVGTADKLFWRRERIKARISYNSYDMMIISKACCAVQRTGAVQGENPRPSAFRYNMNAGEAIMGG